MIDVDHSWVDLTNSNECIINEDLELDERNFFDLWIKEQVNTRDSQHQDMLQV